MKVKQESPQGLLFSYDYQSEPNKIDNYKYEQKSPTPPPSPLPNSSYESFGLHRSKKSEEISLINSKEIDDWNLLWKNLVDLMTEITQFPSFLIQNSNDQRKSLLILTQKVCEIAKNPKESREYKDLLKENEIKDNEIKKLENENIELKSEIENLRLAQKDELSHLSNKVQQMEKIAIQIEDLTSQVDKKKEAAQMSIQKYSSKSNLYMLQTDLSENTEQQTKINHPIKNDAHSNTRKNNCSKNAKKTKKKISKPKKNKTDLSNENSPLKNNISFQIEENQRFEEDYISKLIQKYTKSDNANQNTQLNNNTDNFSLFDRSLKPIKDRELKNHANKEKKRRAWH